MKTAKKKSPFRRVKIWAVVTALLLVVMIAANYLALNMFNGFLDTALGGQRPIYEENTASMYPASEAESKEEALRNAQEFNVEIAREGFVLLKNDAQALPLKKGAKISVFGKNSVNLSYGGSGSGGFDTSGSKNLYDSLEAAGFRTNDTLRAFYQDNGASGAARAANSSDLDSGSNQRIAVAETPQAKYTDKVKKSYSEYSDAAIVVITRIGGEGFDLPRYQGSTDGTVSPDSHYLELDKNERDLLAAVCDAGFGHVIVLFNIPSSFEATFLTDPAYAAFADRIDAALWVGFTGSTGIMALGDILTGEVNPSGRLVDTWAADFSKDPTFINFGTGAPPDDSDKYDGGLYYFVDYEEGVYVGYRYYETRGYTDGEAWYQQNVVYPFGYGLSYTTFDWQVQQPKATELTQDGVIRIDVTVKNTGSVAGKDVVQLYASAPYTAGGIEKAHKVLVAYAKTDLLQPGKSQTLTLAFDPYSAASYDYRDANANGFTGYELEAGDYTLYVSRNAHDAVDTVVCHLAADICYDADPVTGNAVENRYTGVEDTLDSDWQLSTMLSRADWESTWPTAPTAAERAGTSRLYEELENLETNNPNDYSEEEYPWFGEETELTIRSLLPEEAQSGFRAIVDYDDERWEELLDAMWEDEMLDLINYGAYRTVAVESIGLPATLHGDGPAGFTSFLNRLQVTGTCQYVSEPVMAATWNIALMEELGRKMGEEGIMGDTGTGMPYSSIYAPGVNIHRSPFGGRCSEYFSEDPLLAGKMAAAEIRGCQEKGVVCMVKHFAANEQETHRSINGDCSWMTEQSLREIYLKSFEIAVKEGESRGLMSSFNRIGTRWTGGDYRLLTDILRDEWGFRGTVICDFNTIPQYMNPRMMFYAGGDLDLATLSSSMWEDCDPSETGDAIILRRAAKNILYAFANSNAMNAEVVGYKVPLWHLALYALDGVVGAALIIWGVAAIVSACRKRKQQTA